MEQTEKNRIRRIAAKRRMSLPAEEAAALSATISRRIEETEAFQEARIVCLYFPIHQEVDVTLLIEACREAGKRTAAPRIHGQTMDFYYFDDENALRPGTYGILEPAGDAAVEEPALIILPGVAFDRECHRIGHGGGYYDRYLAVHPEHQTLAAAYEIQVFERIPAEEFDVRPALVVTEKTTFFSAEK